MPFDVIGDGPPALFIALDGFIRSPQEDGHLLLGLSHLPPDFDKFFAFHGVELFIIDIDRRYHGVVYMSSKKNNASPKRRGTSL